MSCYRGKLLLLTMGLVVVTMLLLGCERTRQEVGSRKSCPDFTDAVEKLNPAVVRIVAFRRVGDRADGSIAVLRPTVQIGEGTGFVVDPRGYLLTNDHLVHPCARIQVRLADGREVPARFVGGDQGTDLALLRVDAGPLPAIPFGDSDRLRIGEWVCAIGNPFRFEHTVTVGVVSSKGRKVFDDSLDAYIQTDAAISLGNSGGPLINLAGEVVGINTAVSRAGEGIGFAIPINVARDILERLRSQGQVSRGYLGIQLEDVSADIADFLALSDDQGALVLDVRRGSAGETAGLQRYDVIRGVAGKSVADADAVVRIVSEMEPGSEVALRISRDGSVRTMRARLTARPGTSSQGCRENGSASEAGRFGDALGLKVRDLGAEERRRLEEIRGWSGVLIEDVGAFSIGAEQLERGDIIIEVNRNATPDVASYQHALSTLAPAAAAWLFVYRAQPEMTFLVRTELEAR